MNPEEGKNPSPHYKPWSKVATPAPNLSRLDWDFKRSQDTQDRREAYWKDRDYTPIPPSVFQEHPRAWLEIGAGTGAFFVELARRNPDAYLVAIERCRLRGRRLVKKVQKSGLKNIAGFRGNAVPAIITSIPSESLERIYILYPCPWPKNSQRKNRWYLHAIMPHLHRILKTGGKIIWASDQEFYITEATFVSERRYGMKSLASGKISVNPHNDLEQFPEGRTKFERSFLSLGQPCFELVSQKQS